MILIFEWFYLQLNQPKLEHLGNFHHEVTGFRDERGREKGI
jgi:hypothetical protein